MVTVVKGALMVAFPRNAKLDELRSLGYSFKCVRKGRSDGNREADSGQVVR